MKLTYPQAGLWGAVSALVMYVIVAVIYRLQGYILSVGFIPAIVLGFAAIFVAVVAWRLRKMISRGDEIDGLGATRTLVASQTVALVGAIGIGVVVAILVHLIPLLDTPRGSRELIHHLLVLIAPVAAVVAGFFGQWCCQVPPEDPSDIQTS